MSNLYEEVCSKVDSRYHKRINEILTVLDPKEKHVVKHTKNASVLKNTIKSLMEDRDGYVRVDGSMSTLNGTVTVYPTIRFSGNFIVVLMKNRMFNPNSGSVSVSSTLVIFEEAANDLSTRVRGVS